MRTTNNYTRSSAAPLLQRVVSWRRNIEISKEKRLILDFYVGFKFVRGTLDFLCSVHIQAFALGHAFNIHSTLELVFWTETGFRHILK